MKTHFKFLFPILITLNCAVAKAEFVVGPSAFSDEDEVVISTSVIDELSFEEPSFASPVSPKEVRRALASDWAPVQSATWTGGQLQVLKDIPYTPSSLSRTSIEAEVLSRRKKK